MDRIDKKLITLLQKNARYSLKQLAESIFLSSPAVAARLEKLEREGTIAGYHAEVDLQKAGYPVLAFITLEMFPKYRKELGIFVEGCPNILEVHCMTGHYSMLLKAAFQNTQELDHFIGQLQHFGSTSTQIVLSTQIRPRGIRLLEEKERKEKQ